MSCPLPGHHPSAQWTGNSLYGRPVVGISICSTCGKRARVRDFILWAIQPVLPLWGKEDYEEASE